MRYVFIDEAGTSRREPVSVVVGVIIHADKQCLPAERAVNANLVSIPKNVREKCPVFHAKKIWGDKELRESWSFQERKALLQAMMSIPRDINLALAVGACRRDTSLPPAAIQKVSLTHAHHAIAFQECIAQADLWIRKYAAANEVATVIAEDVPENKDLLCHVAKYLKTVGYVIPSEDVRMGRPAVSATLVDRDEFRTRRISKIRLPVHFVEKQDEPLLQIADACAFGFRRFLSKQSHGMDFIASIIGEPQNLSQFEVGVAGGGGLFSWTEKPNVSYRFGPWEG